jgi:gluconate 2-dehydrogenase gamma chain
LAIGCAAHEQGSWDFLSDAQARTLKTICDQIIPADDYPSASQAGVLTYIDLQLTRHYGRYRDAYRQGLERAESLSRKRFGRELDSLTPLEQLQAVTDIEQQDRKFFNLVLVHTMEGYYGSPRHGGNRDGVSWRMLGLADPPVLGRAQYSLTREPGV